MNESTIEHAEILIGQSRYEDALQLLGRHLEQYPEDFFARYYYVLSLLQTGQTDKSRVGLNSLLSEDLDSPMVLSLAAQQALAEEKYADAESFAHKWMNISPTEDSYTVMARIKLAQRNYDKALDWIGKALALDPQNLEVLNLKIYIEGFLGRPETQVALDSALSLDPENPYTIANHGMQLLREGKTKQALERLRYAMSLNPTNQVARYALLEAIKSKFFLYRWFFKYQEFTARLTSTQMWVFLLATFFGMRFLRRLANINDELAIVLGPVIYIAVGLILLTWIITPLMNLILLLNRFGRLLLDEKHKTMAGLTGLTLLPALVFLISYLWTRDEQLLLPAVVFVLLALPLGTFMNIDHPRNKKIITVMTVSIVALGLLGALLQISGLTSAALIGIFIYQWVYNGMMIKENARIG